MTSDDINDVHDVNNVSDPLWYKSASCFNVDPKFFTYVEEDSKEVNEERFLLGEIICSGCPVITDCWRDTDEVDRTWTMRAGAWPEAYFWEEKSCPNGHDITDPSTVGADNRCLVCRNEQLRARRAALVD